MTQGVPHPAKTLRVHVLPGVEGEDSDDAAHGVPPRGSGVSRLPEDHVVIVEEDGLPGSEPEPRGDA